MSAFQPCRPPRSPPPRSQSPRSQSPRSQSLHPGRATRLAQACAAALAIAVPATAAPLRVVELFQSRDCPACPAARGNLDAIAVRADTLALSWPVSFRAPAEWAAAGARAEFMRRQADYVVATGVGEVATPQMILNGRLVLPGNDAAQVAVALARATALEARPQLELVRGRVAITGRPPRGTALDLWLVEFVPVALADGIAGEARVHRNLVRSVRHLARWAGGAIALPMPVPAAGRRGAVLLQHAGMGAIVAALEVPVPPAEAAATARSAEVTDQTPVRKARRLGS